QAGHHHTEEDVAPGDVAGQQPKHGHAGRIGSAHLMRHGDGEHPPSVGVATGNQGVSPSTIGLTTVRLSPADQTLATAAAAKRKSWLIEVFSGSSTGMICS